MGLRNRALLQSLILLIFVSTALVPAPVRSASPPEYQVKAAFIYNFAKFIEWPAEVFQDGRPFVIGIVGHDPFGGLIDEAVSGKTVRERKIIVNRYTRIEDAVDSHILFIGNSEGESAARILRRLGKAPVLTVSDLDEFADEGGMIQLVTEQNRVRFIVNIAAVDQAGLKPSSQLLKLARIINGPVQ